MKTTLGSTLVMLTLFLAMGNAVAQETDAAPVLATPAPKASVSTSIGTPDSAADSMHDLLARQKIDVKVFIDANSK